MWRLTPQKTSIEENHVHVCSQASASENKSLEILYRDLFQLEIHFWDNVKRKVLEFKIIKSDKIGNISFIDYIQVHYNIIPLIATLHSIVLDGKRTALNISVINRFVRLCADQFKFSYRKFQYATELRRSSKQIKF